MTISLSKESLLSVIGGTSPATTERISFLGSVHRVEDVRGGELFVEIGEGEALAAFERGAALCLVREATGETVFPEPGRLISVQDPIDAYARLGGWWRKQIACPVIAISASLATGGMPGMLARILLGAGQGVYSLRGAEPRLTMASALCSLSRSHGWAVIALPELSDPGFSSVCRLSSPDVAVLGSDGDLSGVRAAALEAEPAIVAEEGAIARTEGFSTYGTGPACSARISAIKVAIRGTSFALSLGEETIDLRIRQLGSRAAFAAAGAVLAARALPVRIELDRVAAALSEYVDATSPISYVELDDDARIVFDNRPPVDSDQLSDLAILCRELRESGSKVGVLLSYAGLEEPPAGSDDVLRSLLDAGPRFVIEWQARRPRAAVAKEVIAASELSELFEHSKRLDFDALLVRGALRPEVVSWIVTNWQSLRTNVTDMQ